MPERDIKQFEPCDWKEIDELIDNGSGSRLLRSTVEELAQTYLREVDDKHIIAFALNRIGLFGEKWSEDRIAQATRCTQVRVNQMLKETDRVIAKNVATDVGQAFR